MCTVLRCTTTHQSLMSSTQSNASVSGTRTVYSSNMHVCVHVCAYVCVWRGASGIVLADYRKHGGFERCSVLAAYNGCRQFIPCLGDSECEKMFPKVMWALLFSDFVGMPTPRVLERWRSKRCSGLQLIRWLII